MKFYIQETVFVDLAQKRDMTSLFGHQKNEGEEKKNEKFYFFSKKDLTFWKKGV